MYRLDIYFQRHPFNYGSSYNIVIPLDLSSLTSNTSQTMYFYYRDSLNNFIQCPHVRAFVNTHMYFVQINSDAVVTNAVPPGSGTVYPMISLYTSNEGTNILFSPNTISLYSFNDMFNTNFTVSPQWGNGIWPLWNDVFVATNMENVPSARYDSKLRSKFGAQPFAFSGIGDGVGSFVTGIYFNPLNVRKGIFRNETVSLVDTGITKPYIAFTFAMRLYYQSASDAAGLLFAYIGTTTDKSTAILRGIGIAASGGGGDQYAFIRTSSSDVNAVTFTNLGSTGYAGGMLQPRFLSFIINRPNTSTLSISYCMSGATNNATLFNTHYSFNTENISTTHDSILTFGLQVHHSQCWYGLCGNWWGAMDVNTISVGSVLWYYTTPIHTITVNKLRPIIYAGVGNDRRQITTNTMFVLQSLSNPGLVVILHEYDSGGNITNSYITKYSVPHNIVSQLTSTNGRTFVSGTFYRTAINTQSLSGNVFTVILHDTTNNGYPNRLLLVPIYMTNLRTISGVNVSDRGVFGINVGTYKVGDTITLKQLVFQQAFTINGQTYITETQHLDHVDTKNAYSLHIDNLEHADTAGHIDMPHQDVPTQNIYHNHTNQVQPHINAHIDQLHRDSPHINNWLDSWSNIPPEHQNVQPHSDGWFDEITEHINHINYPHSNHTDGHNDHLDSHINEEHNDVTEYLDHSNQLCIETHADYTKTIEHVDMPAVLHSDSAFLLYTPHLDASHTDLHLDYGQSLDWISFKLFTENKTNGFDTFNIAYNSSTGSSPYVTGLPRSIYLDWI